MEIKKDIGAEIIDKIEEVNIMVERMINKIKKLEAEKNGRKELSPSCIDGKQSFLMKLRRKLVRRA